MTVFELNQNFYSAVPIFFLGTAEFCLFRQPVDNGKQQHPTGILYYYIHRIIISAGQGRSLLLSLVVKGL